MQAQPSIALLVFLVALCSGAPRVASAGRAIEFEPLYSSAIGSLNQSLLSDYVFRDGPSWCGFWSEAFVDVSPPPACPSVDFRHEIVIASVNSEGGCSRSRIASITWLGRRRAVEVLVTHSDPARDSNCICVASAWQALHAVAVPKPIGSVAFSTEYVEFDCH